MTVTADHFPTMGDIDVVICAGDYEAWPCTAIQEGDA